MNSSSGSLASVVRQVRALLWTARVELSGAFRYRASFVSDIVVYTVILTLFMMSGSGHSLSEKYGVADYRSLLFAGYIAWTFANSALVSSVNNTSAELSRGTFYRKLNACCPLPLIQLGELLSTVLMNCIVAFAVAIIGGIAWDLRLYVSGVSVGAIAMCSLGMYGMGLLLNGATIKYKRVGSLLFLFQLGLLFVTDTIPSDSIVLSVTRLVPLTACNDLIRLSMIGADFVEPAVRLCASSLAWLALGYVVFRFLLFRAKKMGIYCITRWDKNGRNRDARIRRCC